MSGLGGSACRLSGKFPSPAPVNPSPRGRRCPAGADEGQRYTRQSRCPLSCKLQNQNLGPRTSYLAKRLFHPDNWAILPSDSHPISISIWISISLRYLPGQAGYQKTETRWSLQLCCWMNQEPSIRFAPFPPARNAGSPNRNRYRNRKVRNHPGEQFGCFACRLSGVFPSPGLRPPSRSLTGFAYLPWRGE